MNSVRPGVGVRSAGSATLDVVLRYIEQHYRGPIKLADVATAAHFSSAYLTDFVRRETGLPIHRWIVEHRMAEAKRLLVETDASVASIAETVGFGDTSYFCRQFLRNTSLSPGSWRKVQRVRSVEPSPTSPRTQTAQDRFVLQSLVDEMSQFAWVKDSDGNLLYANKQWYAYTGHAVEQSVGWGWLSAVHADDVNRCLARWSAALSTGMNLDYIVRFRRALDSSYRRHLIRTNYRRSEDGSVRWYGTATDVEDQMAAGLSGDEILEPDSVVAQIPFRDIASSDEALDGARFLG